ncbi:MAG: hypothetical protein ACAI43_04240 [Phycisphaerae bacterium]|nr:hypothetical protein [Tepidisphaeraceae bacterium]
MGSNQSKEVEKQEPTEDREHLAQMHASGARLVAGKRGRARRSREKRKTAGPPEGDAPSMPDVERETAPVTTSRVELASAPDHLFTPCADANSLYDWVTTHLGLKMPRTGVCPGHCSPFDYLAKAYLEPGADLVVVAPRGGGKTRMAAAATLLDLLHKPQTAVRILGGSLEQSLRVWEHLLPDLERLAKDHVKGKLGGTRVTMDTGASAGVVTQSQRAVRGLRVQKLRCDEVELFDPRVWEAAQLVTRSRGPIDGDARTVRGAVEAISTCHNVGGLMERVIDRATAEGTAVLRWCVLDVLEKCPEERVCATCALHPECQGIAKIKSDGFLRIDDAIRMKSRVSADTWDAEMLCRRPKTKGCVFPSFDPLIHVRESLPTDPQSAIPNPQSPEGLYLGVDFGFNAPLVCLFVLRDRSGNSFVVDEYVQPMQTMEHHVEAIRERARAYGLIRRVGCDPAGNARSTQTAASDVSWLRRAGWRVLSRGSRITEGLELIRLGLRSGTGAVTLHVHPRCARLIAALKGYRYPDGGGELPIKDGVHDHLIDAMRYYYVNRGEGAETGGWY